MILLHHFFRMQVGHEQKGMTPKSRCCSGPEVTFLYKIHVCTYFLHFSIPRGRSHFQSHHLAHSKLISFLPNSSSFLLPSGPTPTIITFRNRHLHHPLSYFLLSFSPSVWPPLRFMNVLLCSLSYSHFFCCSWASLPSFWLQAFLNNLLYCIFSYWLSPMYQKLNLGSSSQTYSFPPLVSQVLDSYIITWPDAQFSNTGAASSFFFYPVPAAPMYLIKCS